MKGGFQPPASRLAPVSVTYHAYARQWELLERWAIYDPKKHAVIDVPEGFRFDLASIPRFFWRFVAPFELSIAAPLVHDWLYRNGGRCPWKWESRGTEDVAYYTRAEADTVFLWLMECEGVGKARRQLAYRAVRLFGGRAWRG